MIPNGKEIIIDGHKVVFESTTYQCRGCFFENRDSCPDCDEGIWVEEGSPWHTGTPTEEGYYLCHIQFYSEDYESDEEGYDIPYWFKNGSWEGNDENVRIIAWQKIEPYEASKERE